MTTTRPKARRKGRKAAAAIPVPENRPLSAHQAIRVAAIGMTGLSHAQIAAMCDPAVSRQAVSLVLHDHFRSKYNHIEEMIAALAGPKLGCKTVEEALARLGWEPTPKQAAMKAVKAQLEAGKNQSP